jgi:hypothetical protein
MTDSEIENVIEQDLTVLREAARTIAKYRGLATYNDYALRLHRLGDVLMRSIYDAALEEMKKPGFFELPIEEQRMIGNTIMESCR